MSSTELVLTDKQKESINFDDASDLLIKGVAGSGKSVVLMKRAVRLNYKANQENKRKRIIILTFTKSLVKYTRELVNLTDLDPCRIQVVNIDSCCASIYKAAFGKNAVWVSKEEREQFVETAIQNHLKRHGNRHRFHDIETEFWVDEFLWIKQKNLSTLESYVDAERSGRGGKVRMSREDKRIAYQLFDEYCILLKNAGKCDKEDLYAELISNPSRIPEYSRYDYVLVDEAQDLSVVMLKFAKIISRESVTIAADKAQKIYSTSFSWRDIGIDIRGRASKSLEQPFRSTKQIVELAESLLEVNRALQTDLSEFTEPAIPERTGKRPVVVSCENALAERDVVSKMIKGFSGDTIGVLYRSWNERKDLITWFNDEGINYEEVKMERASDEGEWSLSTPGVKLCTLHSSKGLEFDTVIIPMFKADVLPLASVMQGADEAQKAELEMQERSLLYVGMTRAKNDLCITFSGMHSPFLNDFAHEYYTYVSSKKQGLQKPPRTDIKSIKKLTPEPEKKPPVTKPLVRTALAQQVKPSYVELPSYTRCLSKKANNGTTVLLQVQGSNETIVVQVNTHRDPSHRPMLGKIAGETVIFKGKPYIIKNIT